MNINRYESRICNAGWIVLAGLLIWLWVSTAEARWMPDNPVVMDEYDCED